MATSTPFDPRVVLAMNLATQPGVYAVLIGSGVSTAAGVPTGWGVVEQLVRRVAAAGTTVPLVDNDWEGWWTQNHPELELGYSQLLTLLGPTPAARTALLREFFEPNDEDRAEGRKLPSAAHSAIAELVAQGTVRVIVTTNFDRLAEHALDAAGVSYQVIASDGAITGMEPLPHADATIIKLHGDYLSLEQKNTVEELSSYSPEMNGLLSRVLDEYGLVISGWSGEWDHALVAALESKANRRYPLVWTAWRSGSSIAKRLTAGNGNLLVENTAADDFFPDIVSRVSAIKAMADTPPSLDIKLARLRRALPDPIKHLEVRALFEHEIQLLREWASERPRIAPSSDPQQARAEVSAIQHRFDSLLQLYAQGVLLDRDNQHSDLWVWVLQQALDARSGNATGTVTEWWDALAHLPAFLLLRVGILAGLAAKHEVLIVRLCLDPGGRSLFFPLGAEVPAHLVLNVPVVLKNDVWQSFLQHAEGKRWSWPASHMTRVELSSIAANLFGSAGVERALGRMEYRLALASTLLRPGAGSVYYHSAPGGEYLVYERYRPDEEAKVAFTEDFLANGNLTPWQEAAIPAVDDLETSIATLDDRLRQLRNAAE